VVEIGRGRRGNLSSAIRTFVLDYFHARIPASAADRGADMPNIVHDIAFVNGPT
jgi:predicted DNA-binding ribbon-helix-helix protein